MASAPSTTTQDGSVTITHSTAYSLRGRFLYSFLMTFFLPTISRFVGNPTASGHQPGKVPRSLHKSYFVKERKFYDWIVYDISKRPAQGNKQTHDSDERYDTSGKKLLRRIIYIPGTSFTIPASSEHFSFATRAFLEDEETILTMVLHPLAPKHTVSDLYPKFFELYQLLSSDVSPEGELDLGGDSSGGGLALSIAQRLHEKRLRIPNRLFLMAPSVDFVQSNVEDVQVVSKRDPLQTAEQSHRDHLKWIGDDTELADTIVSPLRGDFSGLRNIKVIGVVGTNDILEPNCVKLRQKLKEEEIACDWLHGEHMTHCWPLMQAYKIPESIDAVHWISEKMR